MSVVAKEDLADVAVRVAAETQRDLAAVGRSRHAGRTYELEGVTSIGGDDIAEVLTGVLGRTITYRSRSLFDTRAALHGTVLEPYQLGHAMSLFANAVAGVLEASDTELTTLLPTAPRSVHDHIVRTVRAGGYQSQSVTSRPAAPGLSS